MGKGIIAGGSGSGGSIPITSEIPANATVWIDPTEGPEDGGVTGGVDIPAQDTEPEEGNYWLDTSENPEIPGGGGGNASISISNDEPTNGEQLWIDLDDEEGVVPSGLEMELLWKNASPTSTFAAQTVSINFEGYDLILVNSLHSPTHQRITANIFFKPGENASVRTFAGGVQHYKDFTTTNAGITFEDTKKGGTNEVANGYTIPYKVYGIKGVKE